MVVRLAGLHRLHPLLQLWGLPHQHHLIGADHVILTAVVQVGYAFTLFPLDDFPSHVLVAIHVARGHPSDAPPIAGRSFFDHGRDVERIERIVIIDHFQFAGSFDDLVHLLQLRWSLIQ